MNANSISFWIQLAFVVVVFAAIVIGIIRFLMMKVKADRYLKEIGMKVEINKTERGFEVITKPVPDAGQRAKED